MSTPDVALRRVIDETSVTPRRRDQKSCLALSDPDPLPVARADLLYLWDEYGVSYLDFAATANPVGHRHPMIVSAVAEHARYYGFTAPQGRHLLRWPVEYARALSERFSGPGEAPRRVLYTEGEREAVRMAVRLARAGKPVGVLDTGWHDWFADGEVVSITPTAWADIAWEQIGALLLATATTAAHPVSGIREMMLLARTHGVPVIVDESVTGFGRTGPMWSQEHVGLVADLTVLGGPVGGGYPLGAVIGPPDFFDGEIDVSPQAGHPVACCAGATTLAVIDQGVLEHVADSSAALHRGLTELCAQFGHHLAGHHGQGLLRGLRFVDPDAATRFVRDCRGLALYLAPPVGATVVLAPILITSALEVTRAADLMAETLLAWDDTSDQV